MKRWGIWLMVLALVILPSCAKQPGDEAIGSPLPSASISTAISTTTVAQNTVALSMPEAVCYIYSSYDGEVTECIKPADAYTLYYECSGAEDTQTQYIPLTDAQIEELNTLYAAVTEFTGAEAADHSVVINHDGQIDTFAYLFADQKELNDYINRLFDICGIATIDPAEIYA